MCLADSMGLALCTARRVGSPATMPVAWVQSRHHNYKINPEPAPSPPAPAPKPPRYTLPPPGADYVLVKSPDARRRSEIATLARNTVDGLHTVEVSTTHDALDVLREAPKPPLIALVDAYDENDDGELDQDEMSWPLLRIIQRPCKPYKDQIRQTMVIFVSKTVHESPRHTLDVLSAGARISAEINQCVGCTRHFFTKSFLGDDAAVLAPSSGEEPGSPHHRSRRRVDGVEDDAMIQHERAVKFDFHTG